MPALLVFGAFVLGLFFLGTGGMKLVVPHTQGRARIGWIGDVPPTRYRLAGWLELAGGVGLMFPTMVGAFGWLTHLAAGGLAIVMTLAARLHLGRREWGYLALTLVLLTACVTVAAWPLLD